MCAKMVMCRINILGLYTVLCLMIYGAEVSGAGCEEYVIVFKETICPKSYRLSPIKPREINWDIVKYPCNSTDKDIGKKCLIEFDCLGVESNCKKHVIPTNFQNHSFIAENHSVKLVVPTEAGLVPTTTVNTTVTSIVGTTEAHDVAKIITTTEALDVAKIITTTEALDVAKIITTTEALDVAKIITTTEALDVAKIITTTEALDVAKSNVTGEEKPQHTVHEYNPVTYDVNIIYINDNDIRNSLKKTNSTDKRDKTLQCEYAEIVCVDDGKPEINNIRHHYKPPETLIIEINRDKASAVQPLFTGYFPGLSNDSSTNYNDNFSNLKDMDTMGTTCSIKNDSNCKQNIESLRRINLYFIINDIENNTITMYPNCTKQSNTSEDTLIVKCEDVSFAKHNPHIIQAPPKKEFWYCQIREYGNTLPSTEQRSENSKIRFINCSNETTLVNYKNKSVDIDVAPTSDGKNISGKELTNLNVSSQINPKNTITIHIEQKPNNCSHESSIILTEGKIVDLGSNNKTEKILPNNNIDLILVNCMNDHFSKINIMEPLPNTELTIILKNESLNTSDLKQFNGTVKKGIAKQRILLRCDHANFDLNDNSTSDQTQLQCESIDLDLYNVTGIEIVPSNEKRNKEIPIKSGQEPKTWNCFITEKQQKNKLHFENCSNDVNGIYSKNKSVINNVSLDSDGPNRNITMTKPKNDININRSEILSGKLGQNKENLLKQMIKISMSEKANFCSNNASLNVYKGKIVDFGKHNNKEEFCNTELKLSNCINVKSSIINETQADSKVDLTIILKSEALNASDLEQFNGTLKEGNETQRILLRCGHPSINTTSNMTVLQCESIDLDLHNITGIEISENSKQTSNEITKEKKKENPENNEKIDNTIKVNKDSNVSTNQTVENNKSTASNKTDENKEIHKNLTESKEILKNQNFNRRKDIPTGTGQNSLAIKSADTEKILLIALLSIACGAILIVIVLRICTKKKEYDLAPTREPPDNDETAF